MMDRWHMDKTVLKINVDRINIKYNTIVAD